MDASLYFDGAVQVPLSQLSSENPESQHEIKISNMAEFLQNSECALKGYCRSKTRDKILRDLNCTPDEWRGMTPGPLNTELCQELCFVAESASISSARRTVGDNFLCTVRLHCIPPKQLVKLTDGEIFQNVRFYYRNDRAAAAQEWIKRLSRPKQANLLSMHDCPAIMDALDRLLCFPGLWFGLQLGNWAKHLAAHVDQCIINYLSHIYNFYSRVMEGFENMGDQLDEITIAQLQHRSPSWSSQDIAYIEKGFRKGTLFPGITSSNIRNTLQERIKSFTGIIPSIITFHENMKYLTIGTKILERCIELPPFVEKMSGYRMRPDLFSNLKANWNSGNMKVQVDHGAFVYPPLPPDAELCCIQLVIAAIRHFASLNLYEAPLMDSDRQAMSATIDLETQGHLCWIAAQLGFNNQKIQAGVTQRNASGWSNPTVKPKKPFHKWRAGKPFKEVFLYLEQHSFLLQILRELNTTSKTPSPLSVQGDILSAFFNLSQYSDSFGGIEPDQQPPGDPSFDRGSLLEVFLQLRGEDTNISKRDTKQENCSGKSEPGSSKSHTSIKNKHPYIDPQEIAQKQRNANSQSTVSRKEIDKRVVRPIRTFKRQRQPNHRIASLDSTVTAIVFNQQENMEQSVNKSSISSQEDLYSATPRGSSVSKSSNEKVDGIFPEYPRIASIASEISGIGINPQENREQSVNKSSISSQEDLYSATPRGSSVSKSSNEKVDGIFPEYPRIASIASEISGIGINPQENREQSVNKSSISSQQDLYNGTTRDSAASTIQAGLSRDNNTTGVSFSSRHVYQNRLASITSDVSGIEIDQHENIEQSLNTPSIYSTENLYNASSQDSAASTIQAGLNQDNNSIGLSSSSNRVFQDRTSANSSNEKVDSTSLRYPSIPKLMSSEVEYPSLGSLKSFLSDIPVKITQHTKEPKEIDFNGIELLKQQSSMRSPTSDNKHGEVKYTKSKPDVKIGPPDSPTDKLDTNTKLSMEKGQGYNFADSKYTGKNSLTETGNGSETKDSKLCAKEKAQPLRQADPQYNGEEDKSVSTVSKEGKYTELQIGRRDYPNLDGEKKVSPSSNSAGLSDKVGLEKQSHKSSQPLPRLSANLKELRSKGHQYNNVTEYNREQNQPNEINPANPRWRTAPPPPPPRRRPRPAPVYVKSEGNDKDRPPPPSVEGEGEDGVEQSGLDVNSNYNNGPKLRKRRHSHDDILNTAKPIPPLTVELPTIPLPDIPTRLLTPPPPPSSPPHYPIPYDPRWEIGSELAYAKKLKLRRSKIAHRRPWDSPNKVIYMYYRRPAAIYRRRSLDDIYTHKKPWLSMAEVNQGDILARTAPPPPPPPRRRPQAREHQDNNVTEHEREQNQSTKIDPANPRWRTAPPPPPPPRRRPQAREHQDNNVTEHEREQNQSTKINPANPRWRTASPPPESSSTAEHLRRPRPAPIYVKPTRNDKVWPPRPSVEDEGQDGLEQNNNGKITDRRPESSPEEIHFRNHQTHSRLSYDDAVHHANTPLVRTSTPLTAPLPTHIYSRRTNLRYEYPLFGWHKIRDDQSLLLQREFKRTIVTPRRADLSPGKIQETNDRERLARYDRGPYSVNDNITQRSSGTDTFDPAELSPYNLNRNVGSGIFQEPVVQGNSDPDVSTDGTSSDVFMGGMSGGNNDTGILQGDHHQANSSPGAPLRVPVVNATERPSSPYSTWTDIR